MNESILTSKIANIELNSDILSKRFTITQVCYKDIDKDQRKKRKPKLPSQIYKSGPVLSLVDDYRQTVSSYYVLLNSGEKINIKDVDLTVKSLPFNNVPDYISARLLLAALPRLLQENDINNLKRFEAEGVYYLVELKKLYKSDKKMLVTVSVDIKNDWKFKDANNVPEKYLSLGVKTFMPIEQVTSPDGSLYPKYQNKTRYSLDEWSHVVSKDINGDYIKSSWNGSKNRVKAIDYTNEDIELFDLSRVGVLAQCLRDIDSAFHGAMTINLERLPIDIHEKSSGTESKSAYTEIWESMKQFPINIIDKTGDLKVLNALKSSLDYDGFSYSDSDNPIEGYSNILLVHPKEKYETDNIVDPYRIIKEENPMAAIQACYPESLINRRGEFVSSVYEVLIKELLIKHEVIHRKCLLPSNTIPEDIHFIFPFPVWKENKKDWNFVRLFSKNNTLIFDEIGKNEIADLLLDVDKEHHEFIDGGRYGYGERQPLAYWPEKGDYLFFVGSEGVALPEFSEMYEILKELNDERVKTLDRVVLELFIDDNPGSHISIVLIQLLKETTEQSDYDYEIINNKIKKIKGEQKQKKYFYDWVENKWGLHWKKSLRKKEDGFLNSNLGFFINRDKRVYYVGAIGSLNQSVTNFSRLYRLVTNKEEITNEILDLFKAYHIRHKQRTTYPFPFKHLREFSEMNKLSQKNDSLGLVAT